MNIIGRYVRIKQPINGVGDARNEERIDVVEDEIIRILSAKEDSWHCGQRLSGELVSIQAENFELIDLPDLRSSELYFVASCAEYNSEYRSDISFNKYTVIIVSKVVDENWLIGTVVGQNGKRLGCAGMFPKCFTVKLDVASGNSHCKQEEVGNSEEIVRFRSGVFDNTQSLSHHDVEASTALGVSRESIFDESKLFSSVGSENSIGIASVLFDFIGRDSDELSVHAGESVSVLEFVTNDWVRCYDPGENRTGIIPASFLNIFLNDGDELDELRFDYDIEGFNLGKEKNFSSYYSFASLDSSQRNRPLSPPTYKESTEQQNLELAKSLHGIDANADTTCCTPDFSKISAIRIAPKRPPPPKLNSGTRLISSAETPKNLPPPRPPCLSQQKVLTALHDRIQRNHSVNESTANDAIIMKQRIIDDLISSEQQYLNDIAMWETEVIGSAEISIENKKILTNGIPQLKDLSKKLISLLTEEQSKPLDSQYYGYAFMQLRDDFIRTFGMHFRTMKTMNDIVEGKDAKLHMALANCLVEMRALGSTVFDLPSAISRPIHRCLKYPVFIGEILKNTPLNHADHPRLLEALKQMNILVTKMNESKRRKELNMKYRNSEPQSFSKRLSRLNIHTVKKKSNRFKYRLSSQIGLINVDSDIDFDSLAQSLDACERRICRLLHSLQLYKRLMFARSRRYADIYTSPEKLTFNSDTVIVEIRTHCRKLLRVVASVVDNVNRNIGQEAKKYLRLPITKLIQKRYDKLIDYVSARKEGKNPDDVKIKKCDYEALNVQLKTKLPKLIENLNLKTLSLVKNIIVEDIETFTQLDIDRFKLSHKARCFIKIPFRNFIDPVHQRLKTFIIIGKQANEELNFLNAVGISRSPIFRLDYKTDGDGEGRSQTAVERRMIIQMMVAQNLQYCLMTVKKRWPSIELGYYDRINQIFAEVGDVVIVLEKGNNSCLCDSGVVQGHIPLEYLEPFNKSIYAACESAKSVEVYSIPETNLSLVPDINSLTPSSLAPPHSALKSMVKITNENVETNLIDLDENLLDLNSSVSATFLDHMNYDSQQASSAFSSIDPFDSCIHQETTPNATSDPFYDLFQLAKASQYLKNGHPISSITVPPIPLKPKQIEAGKTSSAEMDRITTIPEIPERDKKEFMKPIRQAPPIPSSEDRKISDEIEIEDDDKKKWLRCKADFLYEAKDDLQISLAENDEVIVLKKSDDEGNDQWWLVKNKNGQTGFVPANYLSRI